MRKILALIFGMTVFCAQAGMVGLRDERVYVKNWLEYPYNLTLQMKNELRQICTSQYIAPNKILTAAHCVGGDSATFSGSNGNFSGTLVAMGDYADDSPYNKAANDWAIYQIKDSDSKYFMPKRWFDVSPTSGIYYGNVQLAGFSSLRVLSTEELEKIRTTLTNVIQEKTNTTANLASTAVLSGTELVDTLNKKLKEQHINPIYGDYNKLKVIKGCSITNISNKFLWHNCDASQGASGGALIIPGMDGYKIVGLMARAIPVFSEQENGQNSSLATRPERYYETAQKLIPSLEPIKPVVQQPETKPNNSDRIVAQQDFQQDGKLDYGKIVSDLRNSTKISGVQIGDDFDSKSEAQDLMTLFARRWVSMSGVEPQVTFDDGNWHVRVNTNETKAKSIMRECEIKGIYCKTFH